LSLILLVDISLASTMAFRYGGAHTWDGTIKWLMESRSEYGLLVGEAGEELARLFITISGDLCSKSTGPIRLDRWLEQLFPPMGNPKAIQWAAEHWLNFTHFTKSSCYFTQAGPKMTQSVLVEAWTRQTAILGQPRQEDWDIIVPIYHSATPLNNADQFDPRKISYIPIQVKNQVSGCTAGATTNFVSCVDPLPLDEHPTMMTIWFNLQHADRSILEGRTGPVKLVDSPPSMLQRAAGKSKQTHHFYHVVASGHTEHTIPVLNKLNAESRQAIGILAGALPHSDLARSITAAQENEGEFGWPGSWPGAA
jgi:hypothetical protein